MNASGQAQVHAERTITERSRLLLEINNAIVSHLELAPLLKSISQCLRRELPHDFAGLAIYDPEIRQVVPHSGSWQERRVVPTGLKWIFVQAAPSASKTLAAVPLAGTQETHLGDWFPETS